MSTNSSINNTLLAIDKLIHNGEITDCKAFEALVATLPDDVQTKVTSAFTHEAGWLFCGADFASLEERVGALLSGDPNRIKVYTDGYDGHSMRTHSYFKDQLPDITEKLLKAESATTFWINEDGEYCCE